jgi:hypothetical protein
LKQRVNALISERIVLHGTVRDGVIIPDKGFALPDGATVEIVFAGDFTDLPDSFRAELAAWDQAGADAWSLIEEWGHDEITEAAQS